MEQYRNAEAADSAPVEAIEPLPDLARVRRLPVRRTSGGSERLGPAGPRHNLPARLSSFVGRDREIAEVAGLLSTARLLTLTGAPGVGKTRLALEVADTLVEAFPGGVWVVELAPVADPGLVPQAVVAVLGVREQPDRSVPDTLVDALRAWRVLLVLDNCEHLVDACAALVDGLLRACPELVILVTSREPLDIAGETAWRVPSLTLPDAEHRPAIGTDGWTGFGEYEAVRLFVERARAARPGFALTPGNAPAVARICRRLDGIPLALELAAARVTALAVEQIADRLDDRFRLLTGGNRTALPRQRTLRAAVDWSYDILSLAERALLRRLTVFAGGWTLEAAETVCTWDGIAAEDVLDLLQHLVARSLAVAEAQADGPYRYQMLEMFNQYGMERLAEHGEADEGRRRHAAYFLALAEQAEPALRGPRESEWSACLEAEHDNLRSALRWLIDRGEAEQALRLGSALWRFWSVRGHLVEGLDWLERALVLGGERGGDARELFRVRAGALNGAGNLASARGQHSRAAAFHEQSLALRRRLADAIGEAISLHNLGMAARNLGDRARAYGCFNESLRLFRELGETRDAGLSLMNLGRLSHDEGDPERAAILYGEAMAHFRAAGSVQGVATTLNRLGELARDRGDVAAAVRLHDEALSLHRGRGDPWGIGLSLTGLARVALVRRDPIQAMMLAGQGLGALKRVGADRDAAAALVVLATAARAAGQAAVSAQLLGAVARAYPDGSAIETEQASFEQALAATRAALRDDVFANAWAEGQRLALDRAVEVGLSLAETAPPAHREPAEHSTDPPVDALTRREREVAALIARGLTNREIAGQLVISELTADSHVGHILRKLRYRSRARVAAWAIEQGPASPGGWAIPYSPT